MQLTLTTYTETQISSFKFAELGAIFNTFATELGIKNIKKFQDKSKGLTRILAIQAQYVEERDELIVTLAEESKAPKSTFDLTKKLTTIKKLGAEGTIQNSLHAGIASGNTIISDLVIHIIATHKRPRSNQVVDAAYVIHNIKWFIEAGSLEIVK